MVDETDPACDPAHRPRELDRIAAQRIGRGGHTRGLLGVGHHRFEGVELAGKPSRQTVRQPAEGGVAVGAVPASDVRPARSLARVGAVACERASPVGVIRAAPEGCIAPRLGPDVLLAGQPRLVAKLHTGRGPAGGFPRGPTPLSCEGGGWRDYGAAPHDASGEDVVQRPADRAASCGACGQGMDKCSALAHPLPTLAALAPTSSPLQQQSFIGKGNFTTTKRSPDCSAIPGNPSTEQCGQFSWGVHGEMRETTKRKKALMAASRALRVRTAFPRSRSRCSRNSSRVAMSR